MAIFESIIPVLDDADMMTELFQNTMGISRVTSRILVNRGICDLESADAFLNPSMDKLFDPFKLDDMDKAVHRIKKAIDEKEHITIYGDYDVDGMTSCAVLYNFFMDKACKVDVYIPNRHGEGYGINHKAIEIIHKRGTDLMISVDCGITSISEIESAKDLGMDVIVTDHHQCGLSIPDAIAVINPARNPELHHRHPLAGVGVVGKLIQGIESKSCLNKYLDLIALGTVADVVPLIGDNRILVAKGLEKINSLPCPGIEALIEVSGARNMNINTGRIAFGLAPRLNAAGRVGDPMKGFELLTTKKLSDAIPVARVLEDKNRYRQAKEVDIIREAEEMIKSHVNLSTDRIIVLGKEGWNPGIIGIAASKITERYFRPCILIAIEGDVGSGSARSIKGFNIFEALGFCSQLLNKFGGHEQAAGFSLNKNNICKLRKKLIQYCDKTISDSMLIPRYSYDIDLKPGDITYDLVRELESLEPFGIGNPSPAFLLPKVRVEENRQVGSEGKHLKMSIELGKRLWDGIAFGMGGRSKSLSVANRLAIVAGLEKNEWRGISKLQFNVKHMDMILGNEDDWDELLSLFHLKLFDAFFHDFMYNKHYSQDGPIIQSKSLRRIDMDEVIQRLNSTRIGNLLLVNSLYNSRGIVKSIMENGLINKVTSCYGQPHRWDGIGVNTLVFAPIYTKIAFSDYKNVYIFDNEPLYCPLDPNLVDGDFQRIMTGYDNIYDINELKDEFVVERIDFTRIYRWIRSLSSGRNIWQDWTRLVENYQGIVGKEVNGFKIRLMIKVFEELNFIRVESGNRFVRIQCDTNPTPRKLDESSLFVYYNKWIKGFN